MPASAVRATARRFPRRAPAITCQRQEPGRLEGVVRRHHRRDVASGSTSAGRSPTSSPRPHPARSARARSSRRPRPVRRAACSWSGGGAGARRRLDRPRDHDRHQRHRRGRGAHAGLVTTRGFRDVLEIARQSRQDLYRSTRQAAAARAPAPPARGDRAGPRRRRGRRAARADELPASSPRSARGASRRCRSASSTPTPTRPRGALRAALEGHVPFVSVSHEINAEFREYERTATTVLNAAVMPLAARYLADLGARSPGRGPGATLHLLQSAGGMMSWRGRAARPLAMAVSGPAGGVAAARFLAARSGSGTRSPSTWAARPPTSA